MSDVTALIVTWTLTGIWHGSGLRFLAYGLWYCIFIVLERLNNNRRKRLRKEGKLKKNTMGQKLIGHVVTIAVVIIGQVFFRADSMWTALRYIKKLLIWNTEDGLLFFYQFNNYIVVILVVALIFVFPVYPKLKNRMLRLGSDKWSKNCILIVYRLGLLAAFFITFSYSVSNGYNAFLYEVF